MKFFLFILFYINFFTYPHKKDERDLQEEEEDSNNNICFIRFVLLIFGPERWLQVKHHLENL
jgi:hypothetical protein